MNLKYYSPLILFGLAFGGIVLFSFKHGRPSASAGGASTQEQSSDQQLLRSIRGDPDPAAGPSVVPVGATAADLAQLRILDEILARKNDNDPRLDTELRTLSPAAKALMRERYGATAPEKRNTRGTIVFLLGRSLRSSDDVGFLRSVLSEPPCLSFTNCGREETASMLPSEHHHDGINETTLAYPQLIALKAIEGCLRRAGGELSAQCLAGLEAARLSPVRKVSAMADQIARAYREKR